MVLLTFHQALASRGEILVEVGQLRLAFCQSSLGVLNVFLEVLVPNRVGGYWGSGSWEKM